MPSRELPPDAPAESSSDPLSQLVPVTTGLASPSDFPEPKLPQLDDETEPEPYPTSAAFPPDPFSEPSPPHLPYPHPSRSSSQPIDEDPPSATPPPPHPSKPPPDLPSGPSLHMQIGTAIVIGAIAANVFGFRYSRWAVGKDIHRAWERHQRNTQSRSAASEARRRARDAHERAQRVKQEEQAQRARTQQKYDQQAKRDKDARDQARAFYAEWERAFNGGTRSNNQGAQFWQQEFRVEFDPRILEEMLRAQRGMRGSGNPFFMADDLIQEMLRAARSAQGAQTAGARRRVEEEFDPFKFWEQMEGARWRSGGAGFGGASGGSPGGFHRQSLNRHYSALGVDSNASDAQIKAAYRKAVMKWHPDRYRGNDPDHAAKKFREITEAYNALTKK